MWVLGIEPSKGLEKGAHLTIFSFPYVFQPYFRPGDPQSAQDKARMDKEYLSLMAELGEAPVPASVGSTSGPATTPLASAPRPAAPASNPPPPVSPGTILWSSSCSLLWRETESYGQEFELKLRGGCSWQHCSSGMSGLCGGLIVGGSCPCVLIL